ncbi:transposase [Tunturibacter empetritectus]|uniref:transposase n=1 Tax=Tunturiibacter empetritectus TaxID=3069691 RepID=UPI002889987D|nr:transposase [Edaphobacter lichenicola]
MPDPYPGNSLASFRDSGLFPIRKYVHCHGSLRCGTVARKRRAGLVKLLGISKRGNVYLRKILIHGARAAVLRIKRDRAPIGAWLDALDSRAPKNVVVVAMANKLARIAWAVLSSGNDYRPVAA